MFLKYGSRAALKEAREDDWRTGPIYFCIAETEKILFDGNIPLQMFILSAIIYWEKSEGRSPCGFLGNIAYKEQQTDFNWDGRPEYLSYLVSDTETVFRKLS